MNTASGSASSSAPQPQPNLLSSLERFTAQSAFSAQALHPYASSPESTIALLKDLLETTSQVAHSLNVHSALPLSNPKLLSLYRQHSAIAHTVHFTDQNLRQTLEALRQRSGVLYGEDVPLDRLALAEWCISRLEAWGTSAGMEAFREEERDGRITLVLGGKVLVVDIDLAVTRADPQRPHVDVANVKTSYAIPNGTSGAVTQGSVSLDGFLQDSFKAFLGEVQKEADEQDSLRAARLGRLCADHLAYLMVLDQLALNEGEGGLRWFSDIDQLALEVERFATSEAEAISSSEPASPVPLDIFLMRAHTLPLPYLTSPSVSFLTYLSPLAYLSLLRGTPSVPPLAPKTDTALPKLDIPLGALRQKLSTHPRPRGATTATLVLAPITSAAVPLPSAEQIGLGARSAFPLVPPVDHSLPEVQRAPDAAGTSYRWVLDFTDGGKYPGVVVSQSRMRAIELVVNPLSDMDHIGQMPMMSYGTGSWLDLLLNPENPVSPERYVASYESPTSAHPPLQLRLTAPEEPGFVLEKVPVRTLQEIWGTLEIVREQCWLNEVLNTCRWLPEGLGPNTADQDVEEGATEEDLDAVLKGMLTPRRIPVNVYLPSSAPSDALFDAPDLDPMSMAPPAPRARARIVMTSPERPPIPGLVEVAVTFDPARPRAVAVDVSGAMGVDLQVDVLEEVCRRGGLLGLSGRVWARAHGGS